MESNSNDFQRISEMKDALGDLHSKSAGVLEFQKKLDDVEASVEEPKDKDKDSGKGKSDKETYKGVKKVIITTRESIENFKSQEHLKILKSVLNLTTSVANLVSASPYNSIFFGTFGSC